MENHLECGGDKGAQRADEQVLRWFLSEWTWKSLLCWGDPVLRETRLPYMALWACLLAIYGIVGVSFDYIALWA